MRILVVPESSLCILMSKRIILPIFLVFLLWSCRDDDPSGEMQLEHAFVGSVELDRTGVTDDLPVDRTISLVFSHPVDPPTINGSIVLKKDGQPVTSIINLSSQNKTATIFPSNVLDNNSTYTIEITGGLRGSGGETFTPVQINFKTVMGTLSIVSITVDDQSMLANDRITDVALEATWTIVFSIAVGAESLDNSINLSGSGSNDIQTSLSADGKTATVTVDDPLTYLSKYTLSISDDLKGIGGEGFTGFAKAFYTTVDPTPKFPVVSDEELLTNIQEQTFKYFWDFAEPVSGMARERNTSGNLITSGGSGFGIMALVVGIERNFITRDQGLERMDKVLDFLETSDRFHGAWSHWIDGTTGDVIPFSANDNGGDLVETSFLIQGLLTFRQYLNAGEPSEQALINRINALWESVEWDWYRRDNQNVLYWHWSPTGNWVMNHQVKGWNECLITYVLAASSPTHAIPETVYDQGWASNGSMTNGNTFEGVVLPLGPDYGGPLFFSHYSFLGLDPSVLSDSYGDYWTQNISHSTINYKYCVRNPKDFVGYNEECWGLTASDNHTGYSAHSPTNDLGVITPTAALSSFPYTPEESMAALKFFYYTMGDRLWGDYGFYDAFNITEGWTADSYLAIDQGPIIIMIENYRTGLLWDLFMSAPEIEQGLNTLGFVVNN